MCSCLGLSVAEPRLTCLVRYCTIIARFQVSKRFLDSHDISIVHWRVLHDMMLRIVVLQHVE